MRVVCTLYTALSICYVPAATAVYCYTHTLTRMRSHSFRPIYEQASVCADVSHFVNDAHTADGCS